MKKKRSFFEKLTGAVRVDDFDDEYEFEEDEIEHTNYDDQMPAEKNTLPDEEGELSVDVMNNSEEIIIKAMVAGVKPQDLDIQISRDMVTIHGTREDESEINQEDYFHKELYWGSFSRNIILPEEVDVELAEAKEKHGLLIIKLPKLDKNRRTRLSVKSN